MTILKAKSRLGFLKVPSFLGDKSNRLRHMVIDKYVEWAVCGDVREHILLPINCSLSILNHTLPSIFNNQHSFHQIGGVLYMNISFCCHTCSVVLTSPRMRGSVGTGVPLIIIVKVP